MNPFLIKSALILFSMRREIQIIFATILFIVLLPIFGVLVITNTGINIVSDHLVSVNLTTHKIEVHDPTGKVVANVNATTTWPVHGVVTLEFGQSDLPYQPLHTGIDIADKIGDSVTPFMAGKVIYAGEISWGFGKHIIIDNGNNISSIYAHLSEVDTKVGDEVKPGDVIGKEGETGWATGPHVHFETRVFGIPVNPRVFIERNP